MIDTTGLTADILDLVEDLATRESNPQQARIDFAAGLSTAISSFVAKLQVAPGIPVSTAGTATAQTGATTSPGTII